MTAKTTYHQPYHHCLCFFVFFNKGFFSLALLFPVCPFQLGWFGGILHNDENSGILLSRVSFHGNIKLAVDFPFLLYLRIWGFSCSSDSAAAALSVSVLFEAGRGTSDGGANGKEYDKGEGGIRVEEICSISSAHVIRMHISLYQRILDTIKYVHMEGMSLHRRKQRKKRGKIRSKN